MTAVSAIDPKLDAEMRAAWLVSKEQGESEFNETAERLARYCESPIEQQLGCHLLNIGSGYGARSLPIINGENDVRFAAALLDWHGSVVTIFPQYEIHPWRVDFLVRWESLGGSRPEVIVECDGHDYHERTKEQAAHDRARDRDMAAQGIVVLRFTGSEIYRDPVGCGFEVRNLVQSLRDGIMEAANA